LKKFEKIFVASWTDLDPNWHVANHAYIKYAADTRVAFFSVIKLDKEEFENLNLGPVLFYEQIYYYKEILMGVEFKVNVEVNGFSDDGKFFSLFQNFYDTKGNHLAHLDLAFGVMDTMTRKLTSMPNASFEILKSAPKSRSFQILTKEDMRKHGKFPENIII
jgi:acyl-CoA thioester hydrolase